MKDRVITAALVVSGFALTLGYAHWRDGGSNLNGTAGAAHQESQAATTRLASRDAGVWSANPFSAHSGSVEVQPPPETAPQKLRLSADEQKVGLSAAPEPQVAPTPADNSAAEPTDAEAPAYESQVDRDEELGHASRNR